MKRRPTALANWSSEQIEQGQRWVDTWRLAARDLERIRRAEIRALDSYRAIALLCGAEGHALLSEPKPDSGLVEQQRWFMKAAHH
jgi:hypothetical protein